MLQFFTKDYKGTTSSAFEDTAIEVSIFSNNGYQQLLNRILSF
jgi:hypothetical protein